MIKGQTYAVLPELGWLGRDSSEVGREDYK
jgi:hypothetical protein